jgi:hypothetical protein
MLDPIRPALYHLLDIVQCKQLEHKRQIIRIQQKLRQVLEFEYVCGC